MMLGKTSDISQFCELEWFEWVVFQDETAPLQDDILKYGHYLTKNGQVLHRLLFRSLTPDELLDKDRSDAQVQVMARVYERLGS